MDADTLYPDDGLLRAALRANAVFSGLSALTLVLAAEPVGRVLGAVPGTALYAIGGGLALFSVELVRQVRAESLDPRRALGVTLADLAWVVGSAALLLVGPDVLSDVGRLLVALVALVVAGLAAVQLAGLRRFAANHRGATDAASMFMLTRRLDAPADRVWSLLRALDRIGEFYAELASVEVADDGYGGATVRTCVDRGGRRWSEEVLEMDDRERTLSLRFVSEAEDFPFPVTEMIGGWEVAPRAGGSELTLWYEFTAKGGPLGEVLAALLAPTLARRMGRVIENLEAAAGVEEPTGSAREVTA